jgi:hypothetical protein
MTNVTIAMIASLVLTIIIVLLIVAFRKRHVIIQKNDINPQSNGNEPEYVTPQDYFNQQEQEYIGSAFSYFTNLISQGYSEPQVLHTSPPSEYLQPTPRTSQGYIQIAEDNYDNLQDGDVLYDAQPLPKRRKSQMI